MQNWGSTIGLHLCRLGAPYRASWCRLGYVLLELFLHFYLDETRGM